MKLAKKLVGILIIALIAVGISYFAKANDRYVTLNLIFYTVENIQIWLLTLFCFLAGIIFSVILVFLDIIMVNLKERRLRKENRKLKEELSQIRGSKLAEVDNASILNDSNDPMSSSSDDVPGEGR